jgi:hypothetical protein
MSNSLQKKWNERTAREGNESLYPYRDFVSILCILIRGFKPIVISELYRNTIFLP